MSKDYLTQQVLNLSDRNQLLGTGVVPTVITKSQVVKEKVLAPFYDDYCKEISLHLLSHKEIYCAGSDLNSSDSYLSRMVDNSWFSTDRKFNSNNNSQKIFSQFCISSQLACTVSENTLIKARRIRIYPNQKQKILFKKWLGVSRLYYNTSVGNYKKEEFSKESWMSMFKIVNNELSLSDYIKQIPYQIKKIAVRDCRTNLIINKKISKQTGEPFEQKFKSKKNVIQSCHIPKTALKLNGIYPTISGKLKIKEREWFENQDFMDCRLVLDKGKWFIVIPKSFDIKQSINQEGVVAIDPGVRTFATYFSSNGYFGSIGNKAFDKLLRLNLKVDKLTSAVKLENSKTKKSNLKRVLQKTRTRIKNLIDDLHWKTINFFVQNFKVVIFPPFNVKDMLEKKGRKLRKKVVRSMQGLSFYTFKERLKQKCIENGVIFLENSEAYTSKTNSFTGELMDIGSKEYFMYDGLKINRDINGARNILLRTMRDTSAQF